MIDYEIWNRPLTVLNGIGEKISKLKSNSYYMFN